MSKVSELYQRYRQLIHEGLKFLVVGGVGVIVTEGGTILLAKGMDWLLANVIATAVAIGVTYVGSRYWTFKDRDRSDNVGRETTLFYLLALVGLGIQLGCLAIATKGLGDTKGLIPDVFLFGGICLATLFRFFAYRKWVWREPLTDMLEEEHQAEQQHQSLPPRDAGIPTAAAALRQDQPRA